MRILGPLVIAACALAVIASAALAAENESTPAAAAGAPSIVATTTTPAGKSVTTYSDGNIVVAPAVFSDCPDGWVCIWEDANYSGRMLQFQDRGFWQDLTAYNFNDKTSSWRNRINQDAKLSEDIGGGGTQICMQPQSSNSLLTGFNDKASSIKLFKTADVC
jgi:hypothetical protein